MADTSLSAQIEHDYKVSKWSRNTVADGSWLQKYTVEKLTNRDIFLANAIDTLNSGTDEDLSSLSAAISYVSATHDEYIDYLSATLSGTIYDVSALNEKVSSFSSEYKTFVSATNERFNNIESNAEGLQNQIDTLKAATDVIMVYNTYSDFSTRSGSLTLTDNDVIKVLRDSAYNPTGDEDANTTDEDYYQVYYQWHSSAHDGWNGWSAIGNLDPYYSVREIDDYLDQINNEFDNLSATVADNYLSANENAVSAGKNIKIDYEQNKPKITINTKEDVEFNNVSSKNVSSTNVTALTAQGNSAKFTNLSATNLNNVAISNLFNSAHSGVAASAYITAHSGDFLNSAHSAYGTLTFGTKAYPATNSNYNFTFLAGQGIGFTTANNQVTISAEGTTYQAGNYISTANKTIAVTGSLLTSAKAGSAASAWVNNTLFDYSYYDGEYPTTAKGSIDKITILYKNDASDHDVMHNQEVVFERDNYSVSGLLIQAANSTTDNGKVLTYNSTANNYTWQAIPPSTYSNVDGFISIDNPNRKINLSTTGIKTSAYSAEFDRNGNIYNSELNGDRLYFHYGNSTLDLSLTGVSYIHGGTSDSAKWDNLFKNYAQVNRGQISVSNDLTEDKVNFIVATGSQAYTAVNFKITSTVPSILEDNVYYII